MAERERRRRRLDPARQRWYAWWRANRWAKHYGFRCVCESTAPGRLRSSLAIISADCSLPAVSSPSGAVPAPTGMVCAVIGPWHLAGKGEQAPVPVFAWA